MRSAANAVAGYINEQPNDWKPTLKKLRAACRRELGMSSRSFRKSRSASHVPMRGGPDIRAEGPEKTRGTHAERSRVPLGGVACAERFTR